MITEGADEAYFVLSMFLPQRKGCGAIGRLFMKHADSLINSVLKASFGRG